MALGQKIDRSRDPLANKLTVFIRRYPNDSLIAWSLGLPVEKVREARAKVRPTRVSGHYVKGSGNMDGLEERQRRKRAAEANDAYLAAVERLR